MMAAAENVISCITHCVDNKSRISFVWKIKDFSQNPLYFDNSNLKSKKFWFKEYSCYLRAERSEVDNGFFSVYIAIDLEPTDIFCITYFDGKNNEKQFERQTIIDTNMFPMPRSIEGFEEYRVLHIEEKYLKEVVSQNCLTVVSELMFSDVTDENQDEPSSNGFQYLSRDLGRLLTSKQNADVRFQVEDQEIPAHSQILSARSPVFADMFQHNMAKCQTGVIKIIDCEAATINCLLRYLYAGEMPNVGGLSSTILTELYSMAEKYEIMELKSMCSHAMASNLSEDNVKMCVTLAQKFNDQLLMRSVFSFLDKNSRLRDSELWHDLKTIIPDLDDLVFLRALVK